MCSVHSLYHARGCLQPSPPLLAHPPVMREGYRSACRGPRPLLDPTSWPDEVGWWPCCRGSWAPAVPRRGRAQPQALGPERGVRDHEQGHRRSGGLTGTLPRNGGSLGGGPQAGGVPPPVGTPHSAGSSSFLSKAWVFTQDSTRLRGSPLLTAFYLAFQEKRFPPGIFNQQNPPSTYLTHGGPRDQQEHGHPGLGELQSLGKGPEVLS